MGTWTINLSSSEAKLLKDVEIIGQNVGGTAKVPGAYENPASNIKSVLNFTGSKFSIQKGCSLIKIHDIQMNGRGFIAVNEHEVQLDLENAIFDITDAARSFLDKQVFRCPDGVRGRVIHCSFKGFERGIVSNRNVKKNTPPDLQRGKILIDWCSFIPEPYYQSRLAEAFIIDAGNDEYPAPWDQSFSTISNSLIRNCRVACSKGENLNIENNEFFVDVYSKEPLHLEEFSQHILVKDNLFTFRGTKTGRNTITLGATQSCNDIIIDGNTVDQPSGSNIVNTFVTGMAFHNITIKGNSVMNPVSNKDYIAFWGCGHTNIDVAPGQPGLGPNHQSIATGTCPRPLGADGVYTLKWGNSDYIGNVGGEVKIVAKGSEPTSDENFLWDVIYLEEDATTLGNYYTVKNRANGKYLQVYKGANAPQQREQMGKRYSNGGLGFTDATFQFDFDGVDFRPPGWSLFEGGNGKYLMSPGMNEHKTQLKKVGSSQVASLYVINTRETGTYDWTFHRVRDLDDNTPDDDEITLVNPPVTLPPAASHTFEVGYTASQSRDILIAIFDGGTWLGSGKLTVDAGSGSKMITVNLNNALPPGTDYTVRAIIRTVGGTSEDNFDTDEANNVIVQVITGVAEDKAHPIFIYPNPVKKSVSISGLDKETSWKLINPLGRVLREGSGNAIEMVNVPSGIYTLEFSTGQKLRLVKAD